LDDALVILHLVLPVLCVPVTDSRDEKMGAEEAVDTREEVGVKAK
jgi:hypothetical protein